MFFEYDCRLVFVQRHYAENRTVAVLFSMLFHVELPSYTSSYVYPAIYPVLAAIPGCVGALVVFKLEYSSDAKSDLLTWIGLIGANLFVFIQVIGIVAQGALFQDPVLQRLKPINA